MAGSAPRAAATVRPGPSNASRRQAAEVRTPAERSFRHDCPAYVDSKAYTPSIPGPITGFSTASDGEQVAVLRRPVVSGRRAGFPGARLDLANGNVLVVAQPLGDTESTLHQLLVIELVVTRGAVIVALAGGCGSCASDCGRSATWSARQRRSPRAT